MTDHKIDWSFELLDWISHGETGLSSDAIVHHLTTVYVFKNARDGNDHPSDPADLRRCRLLLERVPELQGVFPRMAKVSKQWKVLVKHWSRLCITMDKECPGWRTGDGPPCHKTHAMMRRLLNPIDVSSGSLTLGAGLRVKVME